MKVYVSDIPEEGAHYEGEIPGEVLGLEEKDNARSAGPICYALDVGISDDGLWAAGRLSAPVECRCVRCLEEFPYSLEVPDFGFQIELEGREMVDLTETIREDTLLALPAHPHCDWDGKKVCKVQFSTTHSDVESDNNAPEVWKDLDNLKL